MRPGKPPERKGKRMPEPSYDPIKGADDIGLQDCHECNLGDHEIDPIKGADDIGLQDCHECNLGDDEIPIRDASGATLPTRIFKALKIPTGSDSENTEGAEIFRFLIVVFCGLVVLNLIVFNLPFGIFSSGVPTPAQKAFQRCLVSNDWGKLPLYKFEQGGLTENLLIHGKLESNWTKDPSFHVAYQPIPKAGSTALRMIMSQEYGYKSRKGKYWSIGDTSKVKSCNTRVTDKRKARHFEDWYTFTFTVDPLMHLVTGFFESRPNFWKAFREDLAQWKPGSPVSETMRATLGKKLLKTVKILSGEIPNPSDSTLSIHLAPQTYLLRKMHNAGINHDFIGHFSDRDWYSFVNDLQVKNFHAPNADALNQYKKIRVGRPDGRRELGVGSNFKYSFATMVDALGEDDKKKICDSLRQEYICLGFDFNKCGVLPKDW